MLKDRKKIQLVSLILLIIMALQILIPELVSARDIIDSTLNESVEKEIEISEDIEEKIDTSDLYDENNIINENDDNVEENKNQNLSDLNINNDKTFIENSENQVDLGDGLKEVVSISKGELILLDKDNKDIEVLDIENLNEFEITEELFNLDNNVIFKYRLYWEISDDVDSVEDLKLEYTNKNIKDILKLVNIGVLEGNLYEDSTIIGDYKYDRSIGNLNIKFNSELNGEKNRNGYVDLGIAYNKSEIDSPTGKEIKYGEKTINLIYVKGDRPGFEKKGIADKNYEYIDWEIDINPNNLKMTNVIVKDTLPKGLQLDEESIKYNDNRINSSNIGNNDNDIEIKLGDLGRKSGKLIYRTKIVDKTKNEYENIASLEYNGIEEPITDSYAVSIDRKILTKTGKVTNAKDLNKLKESYRDEIEWNIGLDLTNHNTDELLESIVITDRMNINIGGNWKDYTSQMNVDGIKILEYKDGGFKSVSDLEEIEYSNGKFILKNPENKIYNISYKTSLDFKDYQGRIYIENTARYKEKDAKAVIDYGERKYVNKTSEIIKEDLIGWTIEINPNKETLYSEDLVLEDNFSEGLEFIKSSFEINETKYEIEDLKSINLKELLNLNETTSNSYTIKYNTKLTDKKKDSYKNEAKMGKYSAMSSHTASEWKPIIKKMPKQLRIEDGKAIISWEVELTTRGGYIEGLSIVDTFNNLNDKIQIKLNKESLKLSLNSEPYEINNNIKIDKEKFEITLKDINGEISRNVFMLEYETELLLEEYNAKNINTNNYIYNVTKYKIKEKDRAIDEGQAESKLAILDEWIYSKNGKKEGKVDISSSGAEIIKWKSYLNPQYKK